MGIATVTGAAVAGLGLAILAGTLEAWAVPADLSGYQGAWVLEGRDCADVYASSGKATLTENDPEKLKWGMDVELTMIPFATDADGNEVITFAFQPAEA